VVSGNVVGLGFTSFFTDVSSEMVNSVVPLFLTFQLGFTRFEFGAFNGAYQALAVFAALGGAAFADRHRRYKEVAGVGYAVSAATRIGLLAVRSAWLPATALLYADRAAKGLRTAPRDALISLSSVPKHMAEAFGFHRSLDTAGALAGPVLAFVLLSAVPGGYTTVFSTGFWIALVGVAIFVLFVRNPRRLDVKRARETRFPGRARALMRQPRFPRLLAAGAVLSLVTIGDALVYLTFQQRTSMSLRYFPLLFAGTATVYVLLAFPLGRLADRVGPSRVFIAGQALLIPVDIVLLRTNPGSAALIVMLVALGAHYAASDGVLAALASNILPVDVRTSGLAFLGSAMGLAQFAASLLFGALWGWKGPTVAVEVFGIGLLIALVVAFVLLRPIRKTEVPAAL
jgi:MFS family permease